MQVATNKDGAMRRALAIGCLLISCGSALGATPDAALLPPQPDIEVYVDTPDGWPAYRTHATLALERIFGATIEFPGNGFQPDGDLYFGLVQPRGGPVFTWTGERGEPMLERGMTPLVKGIDLGGEYTFSVLEVFGEDVRYTFSGDEPRGVYMVFALLVVSGASPADTQSWIGIDMSPLLVE